MDKVLETFRSALAFFRTGLETGRIFTCIAEQSSDPDTAKRTREKARGACRSIQHYMTHITLPEGQSAELRKKLEALDKRLQVLEQEESSMS